MPKKGDAPLKPGELKVKLQIINQELSSLHGMLWKYSKRMLKFGIAAWIFGMSAFFSSMLIVDAKLIGLSYTVWIPLLIVALAAPIMITAMLVRKFTVKVRSLEHVRKDLLVKYERVILKRVEKMITEDLNP